MHLVDRICQLVPSTGTSEAEGHRNEIDMLLHAEERWRKLEIAENFELMLKAMAISRNASATVMADDPNNIPQGLVLATAASGVEWDYENLFGNLDDNEREFCFRCAGLVVLNS